MNVNNKLSKTKYSLLFFVMCAVLMACDNKHDSAPVSQHEDSKTLILPHTPESLQEYKAGVEAYRTAQKKLQQADSVQNAKKAQDSKFYKSNER